MRKYMLTSLVMIGIAFITGCTSLTIKNPQNYLTKKEEINIFSSNSKDENPGLNILSHQVLGDPLKTEQELLQMANKSSLKAYFYDVAPLSEDMQKSTLIKKIVQAVKVKGNSDITSLDHSDFYEFKIALEKQLIRTLYDQNVREKILNAKKQNMIVFDGILLKYVKAYIDGNFVLRNGTKLSKPDGSINFKDGMINAAVDNDTVIGLTTVLFEALSEFLFPTPIFADVGGKKIFKQAPQDTGKDDDQNKKRLYQMFYHRELMNEYFTNTNNKPTAEEFFGVTQIAKEEKEPGITKEELEVMRVYSDTAAEEAKGLSGVLFGNLGGMGVSFLGFAKFSVGDNEALGKVVQTVFSVITRRWFENSIYEFFKDYNKEQSQTVDKILDTI